MFADALLMAALLAAPVLAVCLLVGLLVSVFQAVTQIQDSSLAFVPKLFAAGAAAVIAGPWALDKLSSYAAQMLLSIPARL
ncbi:MAG: flagellar biosynthetic protein FliQ [Rhodocyclaceae bacterium]